MLAAAAAHATRCLLRTRTPTPSIPPTVARPALGQVRLLTYLLTYSRITYLRVGRYGTLRVLQTAEKTFITKEKQEMQEEMDLTGTPAMVK